MRSLIPSSSLPSSSPPSTLLKGKCPSPSLPAGERVGLMPVGGSSFSSQAANAASRNNLLPCGESWRGTSSLKLITLSPAGRVGEGLLPSSLSPSPLRGELERGFFPQAYHPLPGGESWRGASSLKLITFSPAGRVGEWALCLATPSYHFLFVAHMRRA